MTPVRNGRVLFSSIPKGLPVPGKTTTYDTSQTIDLENVPLRGGFLMKVLFLSIDPYMRARMRWSGRMSYLPTFMVGEPLSSHGVAIVLRSELAGVKTGQYVYGFPMSHEEYIVQRDLGPFSIIEKEPSLPWSVYLGAAGMPGQTAFIGWKEFSRAKKGEIVFISSGAGAVGSLVIQLAKQDGLKVIASTGSDEKIGFMKEIGADVVFNYKTTNTRDVLAREGPIDIYWDNVGGDILDAALEHAAIKSRFIECGMISGLNFGFQPIKNLGLVMDKSITINGFLVSSLERQYAQEFYQTIPPKLANGEIKYREEVTQGLANVGDVILAVQTGKNKAKAVISVGEE